MFIQQLQSDPRFFCAVVITVVVSICLHELAHGLVAIRLGDRTPIDDGHMTLNPAVHMGVLSIILLLISGIAWGAMPVNRDRLRGRYAEAWVALAGPACNFLLGLVAISALGLWQRFDPRTGDELPIQLANLRFLAMVFGVVNFHLGLFNLIPIPPLDGSRILATFSRSYAHTIELVSMTGAFLLFLMMAFSAAGAITAPAARASAVSILQLVRGF